MKLNSNQFIKSCARYWWSKYYISKYLQKRQPKGIKVAQHMRVVSCLKHSGILPTTPSWSKDHYYYFFLLKTECHVVCWSVAQPWPKRVKHNLSLFPSFVTEFDKRVGIIPVDSSFSSDITSI